TGFGAYYVPGSEGGPGWLLFLRDGTLMAQPFNLARLELNGEPSPIAEGVGAAYETGEVSAAGNALIFRISPATRDFQLTWFDRQGRAVGRAGEPGNITTARLSPDGTRVAYSKAAVNIADSDIWVLDLARDSSTRLTFGPRRAMAPVWSPDGSEIVFASDRD